MTVEVDVPGIGNLGIQKMDLGDVLSTTDTEVINTSFKEMESNNIPDTMLPMVMRRNYLKRKPRYSRKYADITFKFGELSR